MVAPLIPLMAAAAPVIGSAIGGLFSARGIKSANQASAQMAREQMLFQERMSNTAHQREVRDLQAAGLNPILSGTGGAGSSTPSGASSVFQNENAPFEGLGDAVMSAYQAAMLKAQTRKVAAESSSAEATARVDRIVAELTERFGEQNFSNDARQKAALAKLAEAQVPSADAAAALWKDLGSGGEFAKALGAAMPTVGPLLVKILPLLVGGKK